MVPQPQESKPDAQTLVRKCNKNDRHRNSKRNRRQKPGRKRSHDKRHRLLLSTLDQKTATTEGGSKEGPVTSHPILRYIHSLSLDTSQNSKPWPSPIQNRQASPPLSYRSSTLHLPTADMSTKPHFQEMPLLLYLSDLSLEPRLLDPLSAISTGRHMQLTSTLTPLH